MKIEVKLKDDTYLVVDGVVKVEQYDNVYDFMDEEGKTLLFVPRENLMYYKQI